MHMERRWGCKTAAPSDRMLQHRLTLGRATRLHSVESETCNDIGVLEPGAAYLDLAS